MKLQKAIFGTALATLALASCDKMDYNEYTAYDEDYIAATFEKVEGFIVYIYSDLDQGFNTFSGAMLASATDEAEYSHSGNAIEDFYNGAWSAANPRQVLWTSAWEGITYCNEFLDNWTGLTFDEFQLNSDYKSQMNRYKNYIYESRWARAYFYLTLARQYGGVPLKTHNGTGAEETALPRESAETIFEFIDSELADIKDSIIVDYTDLGDLALNNAEKGRANQLTVMATRAQAALYHASPLFNESNDANLWHEAALRYKELVDSCLSQGKKLASSYSQLWAADNYSNSDSYAEIIFGRRMTGDSNTYETYNFPVGYSGGEGGNCPTQDLVDAYNMTNGKMITDENSGYDDQDPYTGRDPRFEMTIAHNGDEWPNDIVNTSYTTLQTYTGGYHARPRTSYATPSSYYLKKLLNASQILRSGYSTTSQHVWLTYRLGQAYLDYAECLFQYFKAQGRSDAADATDSEFPNSAREMASKTRQRGDVGLPAFDTGMSNDEFWTRYKNERQVELAFEGHRFYDIRRWKEDGDKFMNIHRMCITPIYDEDGVTITGYTYAKETVIRGEGKWLDKWNLFPISQTEIMKSGEAMEQNPGW